MTKRPTKCLTRFDIASDRWKEQVAGKIVDGYGVDDIAIWLDCHYGYIVAEVEVLRRSGKLAQWWPAP